MRDASGAPLNTDRDTMRVTINATRIEDAKPKLTVAPGEDFVLNARAPVDPDGSTQSRERSSTRLDLPGTYRIGLNVFDSIIGGTARNDSDLIITVNALPVTQAGSDRLVASGEPLVLDAGQNFDTDGRIFSYLWEFDDGYDTQSTVQVKRSYDVPGVWSVQLFVTDDADFSNSTGNDDLTIRVNAQLVAAPGPDIETDTLRVLLGGSASSDADGDALIYQ